MKITRLKQYITPGIAGLLFIGLYIPVFAWLVQVWLQDDNYSHGFLILPLSLLIAWTKKDRLIPEKTPLPGILVFILGIFTYAFGYVFHIDWLWTVSFLIVLAGILLYLYGTRGLKTMAFPLIFLVFMIPFASLDTISIPLQNISATASGWLADVTGLPVTRNGVEIILPDASFTVGIPCSGMNTLLSMLALAVLLLYCTVSPYYRKVVLFVLVFPVAVLANSIRIYLIILIAHFAGMDAAMMYFHDYSSLLLFVLAILFLIFLIKIFRCRFKTIEELRHG